MNSKLYLIPILFLSLWLISCSKKIVLDEKQKVNKTFEKSNTKLKANLLPFKEGDKFKKTGLFELNKQSWIIESKSLNKIQIQKRIHTLIEKYSSLKLLYEHQKTAALNQRAFLEALGHETKEKDEVFIQDMSSNGFVRLRGVALGY